MKPLAKSLLAEAGKLIEDQRVRVVRLPAK